MNLLRVAFPDAPTCPAYGETVSPDTVLCGACHADRRAPGRVLTFDPDRRRRTGLRLAGRPCRDCHATDWHVTPRGDAICQPCGLRRAGDGA